MPFMTWHYLVGRLPEGNAGQKPWDGIPSAALNLLEAF